MFVIVVDVKLGLRQIDCVDRDGQRVWKRQS